MRWMASPWGRPLAACALLVLLAVPGVARAEDEKPEVDPAQVAAARYARELLIRRARNIRPDRMEEDGVARDRDEIAARREEFNRIHRPSVKQADELIDGEPGRGLIGEAARVYDWMAWTPPEPTTDLPKPIAERDKRYPIVVFEGTEEQPDFGGLIPVPEGAVLTAEERARRERRRQHASVRLREKRLDVLRRSPGGFVMIGERGELPTLELALKSVRTPGTTAEQDGTTMPSKNIALTDRYELSSRMSVAYIAAREIQVRERLAEFEADAAPVGLVSERAVDDKRQRAEEFHRDVEVLVKRREAMSDTLDWLVGAERQLASELGSLGSKLEEARTAVEAEKAAAAERREAEKKAEEERAAKEAEEKAKKDAEKKAEEKGAPEKDKPKDEPVEPPLAPDDGGEESAKDEPVADAAPTPAEDRLIALQLQEGVLKLKMRLLYLTVHRALLRGELYDKAIALKKDEARAASNVAERYDTELNRMRRERQLELLEGEHMKIKLLHADAHSRSQDEKHANRLLWLKWDEALERLLQVNDLTKDAVRLRRSFEKRVTPARKATEEVEAGAGESPAGALRRFRHPDRVAIDIKYIADARSALSDPDFDIGLVALHHRVVLDRIEALDQALVLASEREPLEAKFRKVTTQAEEALSALFDLAEKLDDAEERERWQTSVTETRKEDLASTRSAFEETLRGLDEKAREARELVAASRDYVDELKRLGTRSFGIRVQRNLDGEHLADAYGDVQESMEGAGRWVAGRSERNLLTFIKENGGMLFACFALLIASLFFIRYVRHGLDIAISRMARTVPELRFEPVTVRAEKANAKREKAEQELAAQAAEQEALRMVSKEEAAKAQKMGEGGYSGDAE